MRGSVQRFLQHDSSLIENFKISLFNLIKENIKDYDSRYLMIITKSRSSIEVLAHFLKEEDIKNSFFIVGSSFDKDISSEEYTLNVVNAITDFAEKKGTLILQNLTTIYPTLYDLFNQNFKIINKIRRCRIALG